MTEMELITKLFKETNVLLKFLQGLKKNTHYVPCEEIMEWGIGVIVFQVQCEFTESEYYRDIKKGEDFYTKCKEEIYKILFFGKSVAVFDDLVSQNALFYEIFNILNDKQRVFFNWTIQSINLLIDKTINDLSEKIGQLEKLMDS